MIANEVRKLNSKVKRADSGNEADVLRVRAFILYK